VLSRSHGVGEVLRRLITPELDPGVFFGGREKDAPVAPGHDERGGVLTFDEMMDVGAWGERDDTRYPFASVTPAKAGVQLWAA
jgi:hypothetical protein